MRHYCSLSDRLYLPKLLVLYESLVKHSSEPFTLHVLAMCSQSEAILRELNFPNVKIISLPDFEKDMQLRGIRESRSWQEYCWTMASQLMEYLLPKVDMLTYLDADVFFFQNPEIIFDEINSRSIGITPHRFSAKEEVRLGKNGRFNVGIVYARNDETGRKCIARWAAQCRERCSALEGCGDQRYLDEFIPAFGGAVCSTQNLGVNLGPWSIGNFAITQREGRVFVNDDALVCYHAHEFRDDNFLTGWPLRPEDVKLIYEPYVREWQAAKGQIADVEMAMEWERA